MEIVKFLLDNVLGPVFNTDLELIERPVCSDDESDNEICSQNASFQDGRTMSQARRVSTHSSDRRCKPSSTKSSTRRWASGVAHKCKTGDAILDSTGPKLADGARIWLLYLVLVGQLNIPNVPLFVSLIFKLAIMALSIYVLVTGFVLKMFKSNELGLNNYSNPIFMLMSFLTILIATVTIVVIFYINLFKLSPLFKILNTPKLCFINRNTQDTISITSLKYMLAFSVWHTLINHLLACDNLEHFYVSFQLGQFLLECYSISVFLHYIVGLSHIDFYIRFSFASWLLALKCNLEYRLIRFNLLRTRLQMRSRKRRLASSRLARDQGQCDESELIRLFKKEHKFVSLDEIQRNLNTMDDHLEVLRSTQTYPLVLVNLQAFIGNGTLLIISYNLLAKEHDYFHGLSSFLLSLNYAILVLVCYVGDSFIYYSLSSFVQTVEDEYFMQDWSHNETFKSQLGAGRSLSLAADKDLRTYTGVTMTVQDFESSTILSAKNEDSVDELTSKSLAIKKEEVLFCRELLHQFENHLATPWSKLTFKSHLNMMAAFTTLVAAQIIFDSEH